VDDPGGSTAVIAALVCLFLSATFSCSESVLFSSDFIKLKTAFANHKGLSRALKLKENPRPVLSSLLLGNTLVNIMFASLAAAIAFAHLTLPRNVVEVITTIGGTVALVIFGEITPKLVGTANPESLLVTMSPVLSAIGFVMRPFAFVAEKLASAFAWALPSIKSRAEELNEARLIAAVDYGETSGAIRNDEKEMIHGVIDSRDVVVTEVMVPRPDMIALQEDRSALEALNLMLRFGLSRIPVFVDTRDNISGIVNIKDLMAYAGESGSDNWQQVLEQRAAKEFAVPPYFVPETKNVRSLLQEMKQGGIHMSIVVDEYDGVSGLVTLEDLVEEIVGEIRDEYDIRESDPIVLSDHAWEVPGRMSLIDLEDYTGIEIDSEDMDTIAGVVMKCLDRVPSPGDSVMLDDPPVRILVKEVKGPRIRKVLIEKLEKPEGEVTE